MSDDEIPSQVYAALISWLPGQTFLLLHHSRKQKHGSDGKAIEQTMEDAFGSQFWSADAASVFMLSKTGKETARLVHGKSQSLELADPIPVYVDRHTSTLCLFETRKAETAENRLKTWEAKARSVNKDFDSLNVEAKVKLLMEVSGKRRRTIYDALKIVKSATSAKQASEPLH